MSGEEYGAFKRGHVRYPLLVSTDNPLLLDADPSVSILLDYFAAVLNAYVGDRLSAQASLEGLRIDSAVLTKVGVELTTEILADRPHFPLLALYRVNDTDSAHTIAWRKDVAQLGFAWILPALSGRQVAALAPIRRSIARVIGQTLHRGADPNFMSGASVFEMTEWQHARLVTTAYGTFEGLAPNDSYRAVTGIIELVERDMPAEDAFPTFNGANVAIDQQVSDGTVLADVVNFTINPAPTITLVSPSSGSKAGGTPITITGTGFTSPMSLTIGGVSTPAVVVSATAITATTPPHEAYPTFMADVALTNLDGQSARLSAGFTFTSP